jgi:hypothetical protein
VFGNTSWLSTPAQSGGAMGGVWSFLGTDAHLDLGVIEVPIGALAGEKILETKGVGA